MGLNKRFTTNQMICIYLDYKKNEVSQKELSIKYECAVGTINRCIKHGERSYNKMKEPKSNGWT